MSSSTSSFKTEVKTVLMALAVLAVCELGVRVFERKFSVDARIPELSKRLAGGEGQSILVFGNSLIRDGVNTDILEAEMRAQGVAPIHIERAYLMNTIINDWYYAFKHHFVDTGRLPGLLVVCFSNNHLEDASIQRPLVARYYSSARDIPQIFADDVLDFDGRVDFLISSVSASFTHRTNVQRRLLDILIPHYRESATRINNALTDEAIKRSRGYQPTYRRLEEFIRMAEEHGVRVMLVAMPVESPYEINPQIKRTAETTGVTFIDSRLTEGLSKESFVDGMHMNSGGATIYSRHLARQLADYLKQ
jgi:hypothetical protein